MLQKLKQVKFSSSSKAISWKMAIVITIALHLAGYAAIKSYSHVRPGLAKHFKSNHTKDSVSITTEVKQVPHKWPTQAIQQSITTLTNASTTISKEACKAIASGELFVEQTLKEIKTNKEIQQKKFIQSSVQQPQKKIVKKVDITQPKKAIAPQTKVVDNIQVKKALPVDPVPIQTHRHSQLAEARVLPLRTAIAYRPPANMQITGLYNSSQGIRYVRPIGRVPMQRVVYRTRTVVLE